MIEDEKQAQIEEIFSYYGSQKDKGTQDMVVALLKELQEVEGYITSRLKCRVLEVTEVTENYLNCLLKMYPSIKEQATLHEIIVCTGERCGKKGGMEIQQNIKRELEIGKDGISKDGRFQLRTRNCLKKCRTSPNIMIDGELYSGEQLKNLKNLFQNI